MGQKVSAFAPQVGAATSKVAGGTHRRWRDRGLRKQAPTEEHGNLVRIDLVVFGLAAVDGFHREGMPQHKGDPLLSTQIREPVPGEETFDSHHETLTGRGDGLEKQVGGRLHIAMEHDLTSVFHDTDLHGAGMQVDPTGKWVLVSVKSHEVSSSSVSDFYLRSAYPSGMLRGEASIIIKALQPTASSIR